MNNKSEIRVGNLLEFYTSPQQTEFKHDDNDLKNSLENTGIRIYRGVHRVISIDNDQINGSPKENYEAIFINKEWLTRLGIDNIEKEFAIKNIKFRVAQFELGSPNYFLFCCGENLKQDESKITLHYVHDFQNYYFKQTTSELEIHL